VDSIGEIQAKLVELKQKKVELLSLAERLAQENKIEFVPNNPNPKQAEMLEAWLNPQYKIFYFTGGNRCLTADTLIQTWGGKISIGELYERGLSFTCYAWNGKERIKVEASAPFKKEGLHKCYRVEMVDGQTITAACGHRILTNHGWLPVQWIYDSCVCLKRSQQGIFSFFPQRLMCASLHVLYAFQELFSFGHPQSPSFLPVSNLEHDLSVQPSGVVHLSERLSNYLDHYSHDCRLYDGQPHVVEDNGLISFPLRDGVHEHSAACLRKDGRGSKYLHTLLKSSGLLSKMGEAQRSLDQSFESLFRIVGKTLSSSSPVFRLSSQLCGVEVSELRSNPLTDLHQQFSSGSYISPFSGVNGIVSITPISTCQEVFDFEVPKYHNYYTGGLINHNSAKTTTWVWLAIATMFGYYPWDSSIKLKFPHKQPRKIRVVGQDWGVHIKTVVVPALEEWWPKSRKVEKKKNNEGIDYFWKDVKTGSTLEIMSNGQRADLFEGWNGDLVIDDEPSSREIRVACARGLVDRSGREYFGMTLLKEAWVQKEVVRATNEDGTPDTSVFGVNADILNNVSVCNECGDYIDRFEDRDTGTVGICPKCGEVTNYKRFGLTMDGVRQFEKTLSPDEREARLRGKPSYLSSLIWNIDRRIHIKPRFKNGIPLDWIIDVLIDFHPSKPWAISFYATEPRGFHWQVAEIWDHGNSKAMAERILKVLIDNSLRVGGIWIDPLAKGDVNSGYTDETVFQIMSDVFASHDIYLQVASKDKDNGIKLVEEMLMSENEMPSLFFFSDLKKSIEQIENYVIDPKTLKPSKVEDDFCENLYRYALINRQWEEEVEDGTEYYRDDRGRSAVTGY